MLWNLLYYKANINQFEFIILARLMLRNLNFQEIKVW